MKKRVLNAALAALLALSLGACGGSAMVLVIAPEPNVVANPATVGACHTRAQLSVLLL